MSPNITFAIIALSAFAETEFLSYLQALFTDQNLVCAVCVAALALAHYHRRQDHDQACGYDRDLGLDYPASSIRPHPHVIAVILPEQSRAAS